MLTWQLINPLEILTFFIIKLLKPISPFKVLIHNGFQYTEKSSLNKLGINGHWNCARKLYFCGAVWVSRAGATHCPPHLGHGYWDDWDLNGPNHRRYEQRKGFLKTFQHNRIPRVWVCLVEFSNKNIPDSQSICKVDENPSIKSPLTRSHIANPMIRILERVQAGKTTVFWSHLECSFPGNLMTFTWGSRLPVVVKSISTVLSD